MNKNTFVTQNYPLNLEQLFIYNSLLHHYGELKNKYIESESITRNKNLQMPKINKTVSNKNSYIVALRTYNVLPKDLKTMSFNISTIKIKLKNWIRSCH